MSKKKKVKSQTPEDAKIYNIFNGITKAAKKSEKVSWNRKLKKMHSFLDKLRPIEDQILELQVQKEAIFDEIQALRGIMVKECIHPEDYLVYKEDYIVCKFCDRRISIPHGKKENI